MMKAPRKILQPIAALFALCAAIPVAHSEVVTHRQAMKLARQFFNEAAGEVTPEVKMVYNGKNLTTRKLFTPFYTFTSPRGGFVIIAADNKAMPILAYSLTGDFSEGKLTEAQRELLRGYARDIELIRYDSRVVDEATEAWNHFPEYVVSLLHSGAETRFDSPAAPDGGEGQRRLEELIMSDQSDDWYSVFYTPAQWSDMTAERFREDGYVLMGVVERPVVDSEALWPPRVWPLVVSGRKGEMFEVRSDGRSIPWMIRLHATEHLGDGLIADLRHMPVPIGAEENIEEIPFAFYEAMQADFEADRRRQTRAIEESIMPSVPVVVSAGGGRYGITMPDEVRLARVYSLDGSMVGRQSYSGTHTAWVDLMGQPKGWYVVQVFTDSGHPYSFKLNR